jgi:hypothetical protein
MIRRTKITKIPPSKEKKIVKSDLDCSLIPSDFNPEEYLLLNSDVAQSGEFSSLEGARRHWIQWGHKENRSYKYEYYGYEDAVKNKIPLVRSTKKKKVVYTCIFGNYDFLRDPLIVNETWDYICFTDQNIKSNVWIIEKIPAECLEESPLKIQRKIKLLPHRYLPEYEISIWIDGNIQMVVDPDKFVKKYGKMSFNTMAHPERICIYEEMEICIRMGKETREKVDILREKYQNEGLPQDNGLIQSGILIRKHLEREIKLIDEMWWSLVKDYSHRDQLCFNYITWKYPFQIGLFSATILFSDFNFFRHGSFIKEQIINLEYGKTTETIMKINSQLPRHGSFTTETIMKTNSQLPIDFDWKAYLELNPDVNAHVLFNTEEGAAKHWMEWGNREGRTYKRPHNSERYLVKDPEISSLSTGEGIVFELPHSKMTSGGIRETLKLCKAMNASVRFQRLDDYPDINIPWTVGSADNTFPPCDVCITYSDNPHTDKLTTLPQVKRVIVMMLSYGMAIERERRNTKIKGVDVICSSEKIEKAILADGGNVKRVGFCLDMSNMKNEGKERKNYLALLYSPSEGKMYQTGVNVANRLYRNGIIEGVITFGTSSQYEKFEHPIGLVKHYSDANEDEVKEVFNQCKCFLIPSISEGISLTPIESTLCGCPAVIVDGAIGEIFRNEENCYVTEFDPKQMVNLVTYAISNFESISDKFMDNMKEIVKEYTMERLVTKLKENL